MTTAQPIKRRRACGPKVKTGCSTCKIRRVKCDERKPACQRCTSTGRSCDGYLQVASSPGSSSSSSDEGPNLDIVRKITTISGTTQERRGFQYFLTKTAADLSGYYTSSFWEHLILQASVAEPSLRHSIIAIGSLHEAFAQNRPILGGKYDTDIGFATSQYGKAIGHLRRSLANGNQEPITALMSCILFVCFDSLRGHFASAMVHLQSGLKILRDIRARPDVDTHIIKTYITPIFLRLSIQSILYLDTKRKQERQQFATDLMNGSPDDQEIPEAFECLEDARASMSRVADGLFRMFYLCDGDKPMSEQSPEAFILYEKYSTQLRQWSGAFDAFLTAQSSRLTTREVRGAALLKIHHTTIRIMAEITPDVNDPRPASYSMNEPESFKRFDAEFLTIINLSRSLIAATEADIKAGKSPLNFSTDLGLVAPIYYTCVKCQRPGIRNAAMELLERLPRKEGMWDDVSCAKLIKEFWKIEARHKKLQEMNPAFEMTIPINALVDLDVKDGMEFEWKWRGPTDEVPFMTDPIQLMELNNGRLP